MAITSKASEVGIRREVTLLISVITVNNIMYVAQALFYVNYSIPGNQSITTGQFVLYCGPWKVSVMLSLYIVSDQ